MDINLNCARCGHQFVANTGHLKEIGIGTLPKKCPACNDAIQERPAHATVVERTCLSAWDAVLVAIPRERFSLWNGDRGLKSTRRAVFKGSDGGDVCWTGRMDVWDARQNDSALGLIRLMQVEHKLAHGETALASENARHSEHRRAYRYLAIDPSDETAPRRALVYVRVSWKTTLKGLGTQSTCDIDDDLALWSYQMRCSGRKTGRFGTRSALAIVDDEHPVIVSVFGDGARQDEYCLHAPSGREFVFSDKSRC